MQNGYDTQTRYAAYAAAQQTAPKTRQVVMLYDGVVRCVQQAIEAIKEDRIEDRFNALRRASEIIQGLQSSLDFENGGEIARVLDEYYSSIDFRMLTIHRTNSAESCEHILRDLKKMRDSWQRIDGGDLPPAATEAPIAPMGAETPMAGQIYVSV